MDATTTSTRERTDLLEALTAHRGFLRKTAEALTDEQARQTPTVSALEVGGLIKHVSATEAEWARFIVEGPCALEFTPEAFTARADEFRLLESETLAEVMAAYEKVAAATDELVRTVDLDEDHALPEAPWFQAGARWSNRRVITHIIAETSQHAGHADIIRETIDGQKTMG